MTIDPHLAAVAAELRSYEGGPDFDADGVPMLEAVQLELLPLVERFGWSAVYEALAQDPLWRVRHCPVEPVGGVSDTASSDAPDRPESDRIVADAAAYRAGAAVHHSSP